MITKEDLECINDQYTKIGTVFDWVEERNSGNLFFIMFRYRGQSVVANLNLESDKLLLKYSSYIVYSNEHDINYIKNKIIEIKNLLKIKLSKYPKIRLFLLTEDITIISV
jgi:hypothetical protein